MIKKKIKQIMTKIHRFDSYTKEYRSQTGGVEVPLLAYANWGKYLTDIKDYDSAIEKLETAILMSKSNPLPYTNLGILFAKQKKYEQAREMFEKSLKLDPENQEVYSMLGSVYVELKKYTQAEEILKQAQKLGRDNTDLYINYAVALAKQKKFTKAIAQMKMCAEKDPQNINCRFLLGLFYMDTDNCDDAYTEFRHVKYMKEDYRQIDYYLGLCLAKMKDYKNAYNYALKEFERDRNNPALYILLAECAQRLGNFEASSKFYEECVNKGFETDKLYFSWGCSLFSAEKTEEAKEKLLKSLRLNGDNLNTLHKLAQCFIRTKDYKTAEEFCNKALSVRKDYADAYADLGFIFYKQNLFEQAFLNFDKAAKLSHQFDFLFFYIANCCYKTGNKKECMKYYSKTIEYFPNHLDAYINYTIILLEENDVKEALRKVRSAYKIDRTNQRIIWLYALTLYKTGLYQDTVLKIDEFIAQNGEDLDAKYLKADALIKINKAKEAVDILSELPENQRETKVFLYLNYLAHSKLEESENGNNASSLYYCDRMKELYPDEDAWEKTKYYLTGTLRTDDEE